jgi:DNA modification methylase
VWRIPPGGDNDGPAVFPPELVRRCLTASARPGDPVLDPFAGSGTTLRMAERLGMVGFGVDLTANWI